MWTPEKLAALAAGVDIETVKAMVPNLAANAQANESDPELVSSLATANEALAAASENVSTLTAANATLTEANTGLTAQVETLTAAAAVAAGQVEAMTSAIMATIKVRAVVLGAEAPEKYDTTEAMMTAYADMDTKFKEKFKGGRQSMPTNKPKDTEAQAKGFDSATLASMRSIKVPQ